jgi:hypothetical protein
MFSTYPWNTKGTDFATQFPIVSRCAGINIVGRQLITRQKNQVWLFRSDQCMNGDKRFNILLGPPLGPGVFAQMNVGKLENMKDMRRRVTTVASR